LVSFIVTLLFEICIVNYHWVNHLFSLFFWRGQFHLEGK
jgi:hypothetical protein